jgi:hypothetical protein
MPGMSLRDKWIDCRSRDGEDGSGGGMSLVLLLCAVALLVVLGLVVDGGAKAQALDRANRIAMEAAGAGAQAITAGGGEVNAAAADAAVQNYLAAEGVSGTTHVQGNRVDVTVSLSEPTKMLSMVGIDEITVTGDGYATAIYTLEG